MIGIVLASHSAQLAQGAAELARQMAPDVQIHPAGGTDNGEIGTSFEKILTAITEVNTGDGAVVLYDLGSARMTSELALEALDDTSVQLVDAPLVEGAVAAAVEAASGTDTDTVARAARAAGGTTPSDTPTPTSTETDGAPSITQTISVKNPLGVHARPAAQLAAAVRGKDAIVTVARGGEQQLNVTRVLDVIAAGIRGGETLTLRAWGADAQRVAVAMTHMFADGFGESDTPTHAEVRSDAHAIGASPGVAVGPARNLHYDDPSVPEAPADDPDEQRTQLNQALSEVDAQLAAEEAQNPITAAHRAILADPQLHHNTEERIASGVSAASAWWSSITQMRDRLARSADTLVTERAADVSEVGTRVLQILRPDLVQNTLSSDLTHSIVIAEDLQPSVVLQLAELQVEGVVLAAGGPTSHAAVLANGVGIPMLVRAGERAAQIKDGTQIILNGATGDLITDPSNEQVHDAQNEQRQLREEQAREAELAAAPVFTQHGERVWVEANISGALEAREAATHGADGVGLLRTELMFLDRAELPDEEEQTQEYAVIFRELGTRAVTIRTLDAGGDKHLPALHLDAAEHGFLGVRGVRYSLQHLESFETQLRAILRAASSHNGEVRIMIPMVSVADEVRAFRAALDRSIDVLRERGVPLREPDAVGVMAEVPALVAAPEEICDLVDFVSVGSNDLVQYVMAAERDIAGVAGLYQPQHPAVWYLLENLARVCREKGVHIAVCGQIAADTRFTQRLLDIGVRELSVPVRSIGTLKAEIRQ